MTWVDQALWAIVLLAGTILALQVFLLPELRTARANAAALDLAVAYWRDRARTAEQAHTDATGRVLIPSDDEHWHQWIAHRAQEAGLQ